MGNIAMPDAPSMRGLSRIIAAGNKQGFTVVSKSEAYVMRGGEGTINE